MLPAQAPVALITGASHGIGAATARLLASQDMQVVVNYRASEADAQAVVASIRATRGEAIAVQADVGIPAVATPGALLQT